MTRTKVSFFVVMSAGRDNSDPVERLFENPYHQPEEVERAGPVKRPAGKTVQKRVRLEELVEEVEIPERPNLIQIFDEYDVPEDERILLCSTTAAFYRALNKKRKNKD